MTMQYKFNRTLFNQNKMHKKVHEKKNKKNRIVEIMKEKQKFFSILFYFRINLTK